MRTATVLVIACPHALGLAIPLVIAISTSLGARNGLLVKDRLALERARELDVVIFDKTGTLTKGQPALVDVAVAADGADERRSAGARGRGRGRLGAPARAGRRRRAPRQRAVEVPIAHGLRGARRAWRPGHRRWPDHPRRRSAPARGARACDVDRRSRSGPASWAEQGRTVLHVIVDGQVVGALAVEDEIRPESFEAVASCTRAACAWR